MRSLWRSTFLTTVCAWPVYTILSSNGIPLEVRILGEFHEMRGPLLTIDQGVRLFRIPKAECAQVLECLVDRGLLQHTGARYGLCDGRP